MRELIVKRVGQALLCIVLLVQLSGCGGSSTRVYEDNLTGEPGQVLVVTEEPIKGSAFADSISWLLGEEYPYIPQVEPSFNTIFLPVKNFTGAFKSFRNILVIDYKADSLECDLYSAQDVWAEGQAVAYVIGPDQEAVWHHMRENRLGLERVFAQAERRRLIAGYRQARDAELSGLLHRRFGVALDIPKTMVMRVDTTDFTWVSLETKDISQGVLCYRYANRGGLRSVDTFVAHRDNFTRRYIPGPNPGTYMQVAKVLPAELSLLRFGEDTLVRVRGLWDVHGHAMGGAFLAYARLNPARDSVVVTDGYIYAPRFNKRDYVRQLEAILLSRVAE